MGKEFEKRIDTHMYINWITSLYTWNYHNLVNRLYYNIKLKNFSKSIPHIYKLEEGMATYSSFLAWRIPWIDEPGGLQSIGWKRVGHNWRDLSTVHMTEHTYDWTHSTYDWPRHTWLSTAQKKKLIEPSKKHEIKYIIKHKSGFSTLSDNVKITIISSIKQI